MECYPIFCPYNTMQLYTLLLWIKVIDSAFVES